MSFDTAAIATAILNGIVAELQADGTIQIPDRRFVAVGEVAWDCQMLVVHGLGISQAQAGGAGEVSFVVPRTRETAVYVASFGVTIVRCLNQTLPSPSTAELNATGTAGLADGTALLKAGLAAWKNGRYLGGACNDYGIGPVEWGGPEGNLVSTTLTIQNQMS